MSPRIVPLADALGNQAGGKAEGLARLLALGFAVPPGFVILGATAERLPDDLAAAYDALGGGRVAVRSSAVDEDGEGASFAGQHDTILDVEGHGALRAAVVSCLDSLRSEHALAYRAARADSRESSMSVVVQRMVPARAAGVVFTADPVSARRDRVILDAVAGLGDALVSGHATPDHFVLDRSARLVSSALVGTAPCLEDTIVRLIARRAVELEAHFGHPIDAEWAVDAAGDVFWLQARPITALPADPRELDSRFDPSHVHTKCNIGEMMPGAVTPLTWSLSARGIDYGMQRMYVEIGVFPTIRPERVFVSQSFGHLFLNLTSLAAIAGAVAGASEEDVASSICGRPVPELLAAPRAASWQRARNGARYARRVLSHEKQVRALNTIAGALRFPDGHEPRALYATIDVQTQDLFDAYYHHLVASTLAGAVASGLLKTLAEGATPTEDHHARVAELLAGAEGVESNDIALGIDRIVNAIVEHAPARGGSFVTLELDAAERWLRSEGPAPVVVAFCAYLERHGHRCVREVEFREPEWSHDASPIVYAVLAGVRAALTGRRPNVRPQRAEVPGALGIAARLGHTGVRAREAAKSRLVAITARFKQAYRQLAVALVADGTLPDADLVHFMTHDELGALVRGERADLVDLALARRRVLPHQMSLTFPETFLGAPEPLLPEPPSGEKVLRGTPVSRGVVRGRARVAHTLAEARLVEPGEILIAPITDVGWTPCFATIAGLATDIGSAVSHGAVVAREYGLPALVNLRTGTSTFVTGDYVELDANIGVLRVVDEV